MSKESVMIFLKGHPDISKRMLYNAFPHLNHSVLGRYYNDFKWITILLEETKELLITELEEETQRFENFRNIINDYAEKNNIKIVWKGTFPLLKESERQGLCKSIGHKASFSNKDPLNPYFYKEAYGLYIQKFKRKDVDIKVCAFSCDVHGKEFKILPRDIKTAKTIPINPLRTKDWHLNCLNEVIETLFPMV